MRRWFAALVVTLLSSLSSCAVLSGLDRLTLDEEHRADASVDGTDGELDAALPSESSRDAEPADAASDGAPDATDDGATAAALRCGTGSCPTSSDCCNVVTNGTPSFACVDAGTCTGSNRFVLRCDATSCPGSQRCCVALGGILADHAEGASCAGTCPSVGGTSLCISSATCTLSRSCKPAPYGLTGYQACAP